MEHIRHDRLLKSSLINWGGEKMRSGVVVVGGGSGIA